jgi:chromosome segregation ATPase
MSKKPALMQVASKGLQGVVQALRLVVDSAAFTAHDQQRLLALVQEQQGTEEDQPQEAYKSKSGGIFTVLQELSEQAETQLSELRRAEQKSNQNYKELKASLDNEIAAANADMEEVKKEKAGATEAKATTEGDLQVTLEDLKQTAEALKLAQNECMTVAAEHEGSVRSRATELKTLAAATEIINKMTGAAAKQSYSFLQEDSRVTLDLTHSTVITLVNELSHTIGGEDLAQLSSRISAVAKLSQFSGDDPFEKVKGLIRELIDKLQKEADEAVSEKAYCDHEMAKTATKKSELDDDISELTAKIDSALARSAELKQDVQDIQEDLLALAHETDEAKKLRQAEHADYSKAKADLEQGLSGVRRALVILREYYASGDDASLLQESAEDVQSFEAAMKQPSKPTSHSANKGAGGGIIGVLQVAESDFANNLAKLEMEESTAQEAYEKTMKENEITKTAKEQDVKYKTQEFTALDKDISELVSDKDSQQSELSAVLEYGAKLKERCIKKPEPYEERKRKREAEIAGLKEALSALASEASLQQVKANGGKKRSGANMRGAALQP